MVKNLPANAGDIRDAGLIPGSGRSPAGGNGNPLQYSCLENPMDRRAWWAMVRGITESDTTEATSHTHTQGKEVNENNLRLYGERKMKVPKENLGSEENQEVRRRRVGKKSCHDEESEGGKLESEDLGLSLSSIIYWLCDPGQTL